MKLSIITVNYNNLEGLKKTYESVICQTWADYEWIIIDGGSTDGSRKFIEAHQDRFAYWCSEPDKGVYNAMNKGIQHCSGEYISCMNSGDCFYCEDTLQEVFSQERTGDILYGDWNQIYTDHIRHMHFPTPMSIYALYRRNICHQALFVRTKVLKEKGFDESFRFLADYKRWIEEALSNTSYEYLNTTICNYEMSGLTSDKNHLQEMEMERKKIQSAFPAFLCTTIKQIDEYEYNRPVQRTKYLVEKGGIAAFITKNFLRMMDKLFLRIDFKTTQYMG